MAYNLFIIFVFKQALPINYRFFNNPTLELLIRKKNNNESNVTFLLKTNVYIHNESIVILKSEEKYINKKKELKYAINYSCTLSKTKENN